jgi:hypothetical protein
MNEPPKKCAGTVPLALIGRLWAFQRIEKMPRSGLLRILTAIRSISKNT